MHCGTLSKLGGWEYAAKNVAYLHAVVQLGRPLCRRKVPIYPFCAEMITDYSELSNYGKPIILILFKMTRAWSVWNTITTDTAKLVHVTA